MQSYIYLFYFNYVILSYSLFLFINYSFLFISSFDFNLYFNNQKTLVKKKKSILNYCNLNYISPLLINLLTITSINFSLKNYYYEWHSVNIIFYNNNTFIFLLITLIVITIIDKVHPLMYRNNKNNNLLLFPILSVISIFLSINSSVFFNFINLELYTLSILLLFSSNNSIKIIRALVNFVWVSAFCTFLLSFGLILLFTSFNSYILNISQLFILTSIFCKLGLAPFGFWLQLFYNNMEIFMFSWYIGFIYTLGLLILIKLLILITISFKSIALFIYIYLYVLIICSIVFIKIELSIKNLMYLSTLITSILIVLCLL